MKNVHLGKLIERKFNESGLTKKAFADKIGYSQRHLYTIFEKDSIDTALLVKIGNTLHHDFFESFLPSTKKIANSEENSSFGATNIRLKLEILIEGKFNKKEILNSVKEELDRII
jgi:transcriptional regulator with XRE-family HTH domain